jgi:hypothetical protein
MAFDRAWCAAAACGETMKVDVDTTSGMRALITRGGNYHLVDYFSVTLRSAAPLPRRPSLTLVDDDDYDGPQPVELPAYRVVVEAYGPDAWCRLGFVPSHHSVDATHAPVTPVEGFAIRDYGGWCVDVLESSAGDLAAATWTGWTALDPLHAATNHASASAYATTSMVPPVPAGSAVEFMVDYPKGTCRVAFYSPEAVAGGFVEVPYSKMELRFVATDRNEGYSIPARPVPTLEHSDVELYPAVEAACAGTIWRFAS